ncbi:hypothetical protein IT882_12950 [Microbacterium schleiferi]|uniref:Uncharacterized protein n=1 Tax=Microbacterium schleiferi TaxID=69362 RepID=A0A7S8RH01_9MICO|nr:hypothetical protein [Microbacterium schleiferi]QPE04102.1 hypothetical protein IT882_12950 [Microbacterium schleiferi]
MDGRNFDPHRVAADAGIVVSHADTYVTHYRPETREILVQRDLPPADERFVVTCTLATALHPDMSDGELFEWVASRLVPQRDLLALVGAGAPLPLAARALQVPLAFLASVTSRIYAERAAA